MWRCCSARCSMRHLRPFHGGGRAWRSPDVAFWVAAGFMALTTVLLPREAVGEGMSERFSGSFTQQEPIPEAGIEAAMAVLRHGRLHRYNTAPGEIAETALLEEEFAAYVGAKYCLALASGGAAMACALRAAGAARGAGAVECLHAGPGAGRDCQPWRPTGLCRGDRGSDHRPCASGGAGQGDGREGAASVTCAAMFATWTR